MAYWIHSFVVWQELFVLELPFWLHWLYIVAFSPEKVKYCIIEKTQSSFSHQHQEFGTVLLSLCDWWWLFSLPQLFFVKYWIYSRYKSCVSLQVADLTPAWDFKPICIPGGVRIKYLFFYLESLWYYWIEENCYLQLIRKKAIFPVLEMVSSCRDECKLKYPYMCFFRSFCHQRHFSKC